MNTLETLTEAVMTGTPGTPKGPVVLSAEQITKDFNETVARLKIIISQASPLDRGKIKESLFDLFRPRESSANRIHL
jgi:hypothetical protein